MVKIVVHKTDQLLRLEAGEASLTVTKSHRMMESVGDTLGLRDVSAGKLKVGDSIMTLVSNSTRGQSVPRPLTGEGHQYLLQAGRDLHAATFEKALKSVLYALGAACAPFLQ